jgi:hypothetical protein
MKSIILKQVPNGHNFTFGNVVFSKQFESVFDELIMCKIAGTDKTVYIADHAIVQYKEA